LKTIDGAALGERPRCDRKPAPEALLGDKASIIRQSAMVAPEQTDRRRINSPRNA
jgi:hypothetical protein